MSLCIILQYVMCTSCVTCATLRICTCMCMSCSVNAVAPGPVLPHTTQSTASFELAQERCLLPQNPSAGDIAEAVSYLISARSVTGQTIFVDSGDRFNSRMVDTPL